MEEIKYQIESMPRNRQASLGRRYATNRLKSHGITKIKGSALTQLKIGSLCKVYEEKFGKCSLFNKLKTRKKDATCYLYYESIKGKYLSDDNDGVYIIGNLDYGVCKIGYSKNPHKRIKMIQTGCPYPVSILKYYSGIGKREERLLHKKYQRYKLQGEWFKIEGGIKMELIK